MGTKIATAILMIITAEAAMTVAIIITTAITVRKDATIAVDVGMALVVIGVAVVKTALMTVVVDCQDQAGLRMAKTPVDNNRSSYFSYNSQKIF